MTVLHHDEDDAPRAFGGVGVTGVLGMLFLICLGTVMGGGLGLVIALVIIAGLWM